MSRKGKAYLLQGYTVVTTKCIHPLCRHEGVTRGLMNSEGKIVSVSTPSKRCLLCIRERREQKIGNSDNRY